MAVSLGTIYNPYRAQSSKEYAYECWKDYTYGKNKLNISEEDMKVLTEKYSKELNKWEKAATQDLTIYDIDVEDFDLSELDKNEPKTKTNNSKESKTAKVAETLKDVLAKKKVEKPDMKNQKNMNIAGGVGAAASAAAGVIAACDSAAIGSAASGVGFSALNCIGDSAATSFAGVGIQIACYASLATGILYQATRPNQEPRNALVTLQNQMQQLQDSLESGQASLDTLRDELASNTEDMQSRTEDKQDEIAEKEELYQTCFALYTEIYDRVMQGEQISESDRAKLEECGAQLAEMGKEISALKEEFDTDKEEMISYVADQGSTYEENAEVMADSTDKTKLAESFDEQTKKMIGVQIAAQSVNAAMGFAFGSVATAIACTGFGAVYAPAAAAGFAGGALSTAGVAEQGTYLTNVKSEIGDRVDTQVDLTATTSSFTESIGTFNESIGTVCEQEIEISDDLLSAENFETASIPDSAIEGAESAEGVETADASSQPQAAANPFAETQNKTPELKNPFA